MPKVIEAARSVIPKVKDFSLFTTLHYLMKGGRIGKASALLGSAFGIKPILEVAASTRGEVKPVGKVSSTEQGMERLLNLIKEQSNNKKLHIVVGQGDMPNETEILKSKVLSQFDCSELYIIPDPAVVAVHTGPGLLRLAFYVN